MTEVEFWFLDAVVRWRHGVCTVAAEDHPMVLNRDPHGLTSEGVIQSLTDLQKKGWIDFRFGGEVIKPSFDDLKSDARLGLLPHTKRHGVRAISYGVTEEGGAAWEAATRPDWERYIWGPWVDSSELTIQGVSMDRLRLEERLVESPRLGAQQTERIYEQRWDVISPWEATYWKTLPEAHRVQGRYEYVALPPQRCADYPRLKRQADRQRVFEEDFLRWYQTPLFF